MIPYGGGTSVAGHINPRPDDAPVVTVDLSRMNRLLDLDENSLLATFEAGASGPQIEEQLARHGYTFGHFPIVGTLDPRRLDRHPLERPAIVPLRPH